MSALAKQVVSGGIQDQIKNLLSAGCKPAQVAAAVGCEDSYVSQLMQDQEFSQEVVAARILALTSQSERDKKYDSLEDQILDKLQSQLHMIMNPDRLVRMLTVVNNAKRRGAGAEEGQFAPISNVINLTLPTLIVNKYQTNGQNEVVEVNGQGLVGMPAQALIDKLRLGSQITAAQIPVTPKFKMKEGDHHGNDRSKEVALAERISEATLPAGDEY